jgi:hypothetical protein
MGGKETWQNSAGESFGKMLLSNDHIRENFDVAEFAYFTKIIHSEKLGAVSTFVKKFLNKKNVPASKNIAIDELGNLLASQVRYVLSGYSSLVIIAHSMGGLVTKSFILNELKEGSTSSVDLYISLAVPHAGSDYATLAKLLLGNIQISDLNPLSDTIKFLNHHWILQKNLPKTAYFYGVYDKIVPKTSAIPAGVTEFPVSSPDDHLTICKPEKKEAIVYVAVEKLLIDLLIDNNKKETLTLKELENAESHFTDELFVLKLLIADIHSSEINHAKSLFYNAEYVRKLYAQESDFAKLKVLYIKINNIYHIQFTKLLAGEIKNSHELIASVYEQIHDNISGDLDCTLPYLEALHKQGMIHQLSNALDKDIWWAKDQSIKTIEEYKEKKSLGA